ncbi:hypothetical protein PR048_027890 [Dryococelus australis]|uniref:Uncharacterized protein n=1 Tax=Dryococelus australis TaxID=614101 RepID=A0ABQ9GHT5_9NEOP|nr:hypothetical protein PR048_027890 [Dryococelus australis]
MQQAIEKRRRLQYIQYCEGPAFNLHTDFPLIEQYGHPTDLKNLLVQLTPLQARLRGLSAIVQISIAHWLRASTAEGDDWTGMLFYVLQEVSKNRRTNGKCDTHSRVSIHKYTHHDENPARHSEPLRLAAVGHLVCVTVSPLTHPHLLGRTSAPEIVVRALKTPRFMCVDITTLRLEPTKDSSERKQRLVEQESSLLFGGNSTSGHSKIKPDTALLQTVARHVARPLQTQTPVAERLACSPLTEGEPGSIPGRATSVLSHVGIVPDDAADWRVLEDLPFPPPIHSEAAPYSAQISSLYLPMFERHLYFSLCHSYVFVPAFHRDSNPVLANTGRDRYHSATLLRSTTPMTCLEISLFLLQPNSRLRFSSAPQRAMCLNGATIIFITYCGGRQDLLYSRWHSREKRDTGRSVRIRDTANDITTICGLPRNEVTRIQFILLTLPLLLFRFLSPPSPVFFTATGGNSDMTQLPRGDATTVVPIHAPVIVQDFSVEVSVTVLERMQGVEKIGFGKERSVRGLKHKYCEHRNHRSAVISFGTARYLLRRCLHDHHYQMPGNSRIRNAPHEYMVKTTTFLCDFLINEASNELFRNSIFYLAASLLASHQGEPGQSQSAVGPLPDTRCGNYAGQCRWSAGFLGDLPFLPPLHIISVLLHTHLYRPSSALKTSLLPAAQISSLAQPFRPYTEYISTLVHVLDDSEPIADLQGNTQLTDSWGSSIHRTEESSLQVIGLAKFSYPYQSRPFERPYKKDIAVVFFNKEISELTMLELHSSTVYKALSCRHIPPAAIHVADGKWQAELSLGVCFGEHWQRNFLIIAEESPRLRTTDYYPSSFEINVLKTSLPSLA